MKILLISGTNHKGSTYHIGKILVDKLSSSSGDVKEIFLPRDMPHHCCSCFMERCFGKKEKGYCTEDERNS